MSRAAMNLLREVGPLLEKLHLAGYSIKVVGYSLGGAVAAMLTYLLIPVQKWSRPLDVRCITYGCPSCADASIADLLAEKKGVVILYNLGGLRQQNYSSEYQVMPIPSSPPHGLVFNELPYLNLRCIFTA